MATKLYEELQLLFVNNMERPDFTDGKIFTELALKWTLYFKQNRDYLFNFATILLNDLLK